MRFLFIALVCSLVVPDTSGQTIELTSDRRQNVEGRIRYLRDESNTLMIDEVAKMKLTSVADAKAPNFGFDRTAYWFRIDLLNHTDREDWLMEIDFAPLD